MLYSNLETTEKKQLPLIELVFILFCIAFYMLPALNAKYNLLVLPVFALYLAYAAQFMPRNFSRHCWKFLFLAVLISFWFFILTVPTSIDPNATHYDLKRLVSRFSQVFIAFFPFVLFVRIHCAASNANKKLICCFIFLLTTYVAVQTWQELSVNEAVTRHWENFASAIEKNVGTYSFTYAVSSLIPTLLIISHYTTKKIWKLSVVATIVLVFAYLFKAQYTLSILNGTVCIVLYFFLCTKGKVLKFATLILLPFLFTALPPFLFWLAQRVNSDHITIRLREVADVLSGNGLGYNLGGRLTLYSKAILAFFKNPFIGNRYLDFNPHSTLLAILAQIGLLGGIPYYYLYFSTVKRLRELLQNQHIRIYIPVFFNFMFTGLTNPIHDGPPLYIIVWLLAPLLIDLFTKSSTLKKEFADNEKLET